MAILRVPEVVPSPSEDAEQLRKAFQGWGTNGDLIVSILAHRNAAQRKLIRQVYAETYGEDLLKALDKELSSDFERVILLWTLDPAERDAFLANEATKRLPSNNWVLVEIACTRSSHDLFMVRQAYHARFKKSLEEDVASHTSGDFRKPLVPLVTSIRYGGDEVNRKLANLEAKILHEKISEKSYSHEELIRILTTRRKAQLNATLNCYKKQFGNVITKDLEADLEDLYQQKRHFFHCFRKSGTGPRDDPKEYLKLLRAAIQCLTYPAKYFEVVLRPGINKGTAEGALTRVVTSEWGLTWNRSKKKTIGGSLILPVNVVCVA